MAAESAAADREGWITAALARYESPLLHYAAHITRDMDLARDIVQDTFLQLCLADRAKIEPGLTGWLYAVCRNRALNICRKEARMTTLDDPAQDIPAPDDTREAAARHETYCRLLEIVGALPQNQQEAFQLKFRDGLNYREISEILGVSLGTVSNLIAAALRAVRSEFSPERERAQEA